MNSAGICLGLWVATLGAGSSLNAQVLQFSTPNPAKFGHYGDEVAILPDVNGDLIADVAVGAPGENPNLLTAAGRVYVYSGATGGLLWVLTSPTQEVDQEFGECVAGVPDINGDGRGEILVGAPDADPAFTPSDAGRAFLFSGATGQLLRILQSPGEEINGSFGDDVAGIQDVDGDLVPDLVVAAPEEDGGALDAGRVHIFSGASGLLIRTLVSPSPDIDGQFGDAVAAVGDVNADGKPDILVGAPFENPVGTPTDSGHAYVFSGATGVLLRSIQSPGQEVGGGFGESVAGLGDINGDGVADLVIGAPRENPGASPIDCGRAHTYSGATGSLIRKLIPTQPQAGGQFGFSVAAAPDADGDGRDEVLVGAWRERRTTWTRSSDCGRVHLCSTLTGFPIRTIDPPVPMAGGSFGRAAEVLRLSGSARFVVGARGEPVGGMLGAGHVYWIPQ